MENKISITSINDHIVHPGDEWYLSGVTAMGAFLVVEYSPKKLHFQDIVIEGIVVGERWVKQNLRILYNSDGREVFRVTTDNLHERRLDKPVQQPAWWKRIFTKSKI